MVLRKKLRDNDNTTIYYHKNCVSRYTSKTNLNHIAPQPHDHDPQSSKRLRHSFSLFDFKTQCRIPSYLVQSTQSERFSRTTYEEYLSDECVSRGDHWVNEVKVCLDSSVSDLHVADARYHRDCMSRFLGKRKLTPDTSEPSSTQVVADLALKQYHSK